ncbi:MAG: hypothetical protein K2N63_09000, partial [Lachnospiraceae bacterium]|nr:hypothetical protein [Lachnospiraceae bacterium]
MMWNCVYGKERGKKATVWTLLFCLFISCALTGCAGKEQKEELKEADATPTGEEILSGKDLVTDGEGTGEGSHSNGQLESEKGGNSFGSQSGLEGSGLDETPTYGDSIQSSSEGEIFPESTIVPPSKTE